jgi:hypothetical protein
MVSSTASWRLRCVICSDDLALVVDAAGNATQGPPRIVHGSVDAPTVQEAVADLSHSSPIIPDDLASIIDAEGKRVIRARRIDERGIDTAAVEKAMGRAGGYVYERRPNDLTSIIDAVRRIKPHARGLAGILKVGGRGCFFQNQNGKGDPEAPLRARTLSDRRAA